MIFDTRDKRGKRFLYSSINDLHRALSLFHFLKKIVHNDLDDVTLNLGFYFEKNRAPQIF